MTFLQTTAELVGPREDFGNALQFADGTFQQGECTFVVTIELAVGFEKCGLNIFGMREQFCLAFEGSKFVGLEVCLCELIKLKGHEVLLRFVLADAFLELLKCLVCSAEGFETLGKLLPLRFVVCHDVDDIELKILFL